MLQLVPALAPWPTAQTVPVLTGPAPADTNPDLHGSVRRATSHEIPTLAMLTCNKAALRYSQTQIA